MARYGGPGRAKAVFFTRPSMLVGPMLAPPITRGRNGGAAGNRTRVRSAYYKRVYRHSPGEPEQDQYRASTPVRQGRNTPQSRVGRPVAVHSGLKSLSASQRRGSTSDWIAAVMKGRFRFAMVSSVVW